MPNRWNRKGQTQNADLRECAVPRMRYRPLGE
jgi:hypothetical protein